MAVRDDLNGGKVKKTSVPLTSEGVYRNSVADNNDITTVNTPVAAAPVQPQSAPLTVEDYQTIQQRAQTAASDAQISDSVSGAHGSAQNQMANNTSVKTPTKVYTPQSMIDLMAQNEGAYKLRTEQEEADAQRRAKSYAILAGVGDGISALSNLYWTTQGAPSAEQPQMSGKFREQYEIAKTKRERLRDAWMHRMNQATQADYSRANNLRDMKEAREYAAGERSKDRVHAAGVRGQELWYSNEAQKKDQAWKEKVFDTQNSQWQKMHDANIKYQNETLDLKGQQVATQKRSSSAALMTTVRHDGKDYTFPKAFVDSEINAAALYEAMTKENPAMIELNPITDRLGKITGYKPPTHKQMLVAIGRYMEGSKVAQKAFDEYTRPGAKPDTDYDFREYAVDPDKLFD